MVGGAGVEQSVYALEADDAEHFITDTLSKLFWLRNFGRSTSDVDWAVFLAAFEEDYGEVTERAVELLRAALAPYGTVVLCTFESFTGRRGGLCRAYQDLCDPATVVYEMGSVDDSPDRERVVAAPALVRGLLGLSVRHVCCGGQHAAVLTSEGEIHTWGRGGFGRLGHGRTESLEQPRLVESLRGEVCVQVCCGFAYTAAVTLEGKLFTWGAGENGRLGLGDSEDRLRPSHVDFLHTPVAQVYAGSVHSGLRYTRMPRSVH